MSLDSYSALVLGASGGIGAAIAARLEADPNCARLSTLSRSADGFDLRAEASVMRAAEGLDGPYDLIFNATGVLDVNGAGPEKAFKEIDPTIMARAFETNAIGAAMCLKHFGPLLHSDRRAVFATLSARVGSITDNRLGGWMSYRASKAALNQIVRCAAIEETRRNKESILVALHPGTIKTSLTEKYAKGRYTATPEECATNLLSVLQRLTPKDTGGFFDYAGEKVSW